MEGDDTTDAAAALGITGATAAEEDDDTLSATRLSGSISASLNVVEDDDTVSAVLARVYPAVANRALRFVATPGARTIEFLTAVPDQRPIAFVDTPNARMIEWLRV